eukprot:g18097.t1
MAKGNQAAKKGVNAMKDDKKAKPMTASDYEEICYRATVSEKGSEQMGEQKRKGLISLVWQTYEKVGKVVCHILEKKGCKTSGRLRAVASDQDPDTRAVGSKAYADDTAQALFDKAENLTKPAQFQKLKPRVAKRFQEAHKTEVAMDHFQKFWKFVRTKSPETFKDQVVGKIMRFWATALLCSWVKERVKAKTADERGALWRGKDAVASKGVWLNAVPQLMEVKKLRLDPLKTSLDVKNFFWKITRKGAFKPLKLRGGWSWDAMQNELVNLPLGLQDPAARKRTLQERSGAKNSSNKKFAKTSAESPITGATLFGVTPASGNVRSSSGSSSSSSSSAGLAVSNAGATTPSTGSFVTNYHIAQELADELSAGENKQSWLEKNNTTNGGMLLQTLEPFAQEEAEKATQEEFNEIACAWWKQQEDDRQPLSVIFDEGQIAMYAKGAVMAIIECRFPKCRSMIDRILTVDDELTKFMNFETGVQQLKKDVEVVLNDVGAASGLKGVLLHHLAYVDKRLQAQLQTAAESAGGDLNKEELEPRTILMKAFARGPKHVVEFNVTEEVASISEFLTSVEEYEEQHIPQQNDVCLKARKSFLEMFGLVQKHVFYPSMLKEAERQLSLKKKNFESLWLWSFYKIEAAAGGADNAKAESLRVAVQENQGAVISSLIKEVERTEITEVEGRKQAEMFVVPGEDLEGDAEGDEKDEESDEGEMQELDSLASDDEALDEQM